MIEQKQGIGRNWKWAWRIDDEGFYKILTAHDDWIIFALDFFVNKVILDLDLILALSTPFFSLIVSTVVQTRTRRYKNLAITKNVEKSNQILAMPSV